MNLADAIRKAAKETGTPLAISDYNRPHFSEAQSSAVIYTMPPLAESPLGTVEEILDADPYEHEETLTGREEANSQGFIKIELHIPPEQLNRVLRSVVASQHSVLTLREAAHQLRVTPHRLEELAKSGEIPGFLVDGKWRFSRQKLEGIGTSEGTKKEQKS